MFQTITPQKLHDISQRETIELIDVRTPIEFQEVNSVHAHNVPLDSLDPNVLMSNRNGSTGKPLYVICMSGKRGEKACEALVKAGYSDVVNVEGGTRAWVAAGLPVNRGRKVMSLERQVRIAAGFLAFLGGTLALTVHPYWAGLSAFVGAGLMFAGITDTCAMGLLIAKMPWNRVKASTCEKAEADQQECAV